MSQYYKEYKHLCFYTLGHPFDGFYDMRRGGRAKSSYVILIFSIYVLLQIISYLFTGFMVNDNDQSKFNALSILTTSLFPFLLFVLANYSITTLSDGKGFMKDIINTVAYSLLPMIVCHTIALIISWFITTDTMVFYSIFIVFGWISFIFYCFIGLIVVHEYTFFRGILYLFLSFIAMAVILFIGILLITLFQQLIGFFTSIWREIILRK